MTLSFTVPGKPHAQGRARATINRNTGRPRMYEDKTSKAYKEKIAWCAIEAGADRNNLIAGAVLLNIAVYCPIPPTWTRQKRKDAAEGKVHMISRPDLDNVLKSIQDALSGIVYVDDRQVVDIRISKRYSDNPRVVVNIK